MYEEEEIHVDIAAEAVPLTDDLVEFFDPLKTGFLWYVPPLASEANHKTGGHNWNIVGYDMQVLTMSVPAGEQVVTEVGSFMYMSPFMETEVELTLCTKGGFSDGCNRIFGGESCAKVILKNNTGNEGYVGLTPNFPAKIIPIKFGTHAAANSKLIVQPGAYMSELGDVDVGCDLDLGLSTCCCAGLGACRQKVTGADGSIAFLAAGGTIVYRNLREGEMITVDSSSVVAIEETVKLGITSNGRLCGITCCCGGEGIFSTTLTGPGRVYMQSFGFARFSNAVQQTVMEDRDGGNVPDVS